MGQDDIMRKICKESFRFHMVCQGSNRNSTKNGWEWRTKWEKIKGFWSYCF